MSKQKVLIVDDDPHIAELISLYLTRECYETALAATGPEALSQWKSFQPDLILLDIMLPGMDGYQVCQEIRRESDVPIMMLSAKGEVFDKVLGLELGADDYMIKPFDNKEMVARVKALLRRAQKRIQPAESGERKAVTIPQQALDAGAQLYILALLDKCQVDSYLVPAHTEWKTREIDDSYRDDKGNWHTFYRTITYPEYIPDYYVPYASVTVRFLWFDTKTGKLVASSEDARVRNSENDPLGVYNRIIDRFFKNLKEMGRK